MVCQNLLSIEKVNTDYEFAFIKITHNLKNENRISSGWTYNVHDYFSIDYDWFYYQWINNDSYNKNKYNASVLPLIEFAYELVYEAIKDSVVNNFRNPLNIPNSSLNFNIIGKPIFANNGNMDNLCVSIFVKNNTNFYFFRRNKWLEFTPGTGVKLQYQAVTFQIGFERKIQYLFNKNIQYDNDFSFSYSMYVPW